MIDVSGKTILITDDKPVNVELLKKILQKNGFKILSALNGEECIKIAEETQPDMILLDISMPIMDGIDVCKALKQKELIQKIPIIFVTAKTDNSTLQQAFEAGGIDYVCKPVNRIELLARVKSVLINNELTQKYIGEEKLKSVLEMTGTICHELNQPLQVVAGVSQLLLMDLPKENVVYNWVLEIKQQIDKMGDITKKLMGITSYKTRDYSEGKKIVDIH